MFHFKIFLSSLFLIAFMYARAQDMARVRHNIGVLCAPEMAGRGYALSGDKKAAEWIAAAFRQAGLQPFGNSFFQPFPLTVNTFYPQVALKVDGTVLQPGKDFIPNPVSGKGRGKARLVCLDTLLAKGDSLALKNAMQTSYKGKGVLFRMTDYMQLLERCPELLPKLNQAKVWVGTAPTLTAHISGQALQPPFLIVHSKNISTVAKKVAFRIDSELKTNYITQNVIGYIKGSKMPERFVVFTAHYDHLGTLGKQAYIPGANDNAAGVAMLIELAHYFRQHPPDFSVCFIAFSGEELGLLGSLHYTAQPLFPLANIHFLWNLDLIGTGKDGATVVNASLHPQAFERLKTLNDSLKALPKLVPRASAANSDHYPFTIKNVPAFFIYLMDKNYPYYHHPDDKAEHLPLDGFSGLFRLLISACLAMF
ncbi:MAG: M28 family peptidase [Cytophagales bacterium]|nr:M28 family peptidase [Bernardetiaceae bacterium]MDW8205207.1 M28 family peptidase [Cytophagales bacterium]